MNTILIQTLLIVATLLVTVRLLRGIGPRAQALRRLALLVFACLAVASVIFPDIWTAVANALGVGRGTDLILYALVVAFFSFVATTFRRFRDLENRYTDLARRQALERTPPPVRAEATEATERVQPAETGGPGERAGSGKRAGSGEPAGSGGTEPGHPVS